MPLDFFDLQIKLKSLTEEFFTQSEVNRRQVGGEPEFEFGDNILGFKEYLI